MATEAHNSVQQRLRENLLDVEKRMKYFECERQELIMTQGTKRATINGLEEQLEDLKEELKRTKQELADQRTQYFQLRLVPFLIPVNFLNSIFDTYSIKCESENRKV